MAAKKSKIITYLAIGVVGLFVYEEFIKPKPTLPVNPATGLPYTTTPASSGVSTLTSATSALSSLANSIKSIFGGSTTPPASGAPYTQSDVVKPYQPVAPASGPVELPQSAYDYVDPADQFDTGPTGPGAAELAGMRYVN